MWMNALTLEGVPTEPADQPNLPLSDGSDDKSSTPVLVPGQPENRHNQFVGDKHPNPNNDVTN